MSTCNECAARDNEITRQRKEVARWKSRAATYEKQAARRKGLLREALAWIENSQESAPSLCGDICKALGLTPNANVTGLAPAQENDK